MEKTKRKDGLATVVAGVERQGFTAAVVGKKEVDFEFEGGRWMRGRGLWRRKGEIRDFIP